MRKLEDLILTYKDFPEKGIDFKTIANWVGHKELTTRLFKHIAESETYTNYMAAEGSGFNADRKFLVDLFVKEVANFEALHDVFEERSRQA